MLYFLAWGFAARHFRRILSFSTRYITGMSYK
jgi:hypothetical protein